VSLPFSLNTSNGLGRGTDDDRHYVMSLESNFTISQKADTAIRRAATVVLLVVGISSAILSYAGLRHLAIMAGIADSLSFLFPIVVDGMILLGSLSVLRAALARMPTWFGWMLTILGTATSIAGNILSVENANLVSQIIHSVPPVFLCLSLETFIQLLRHRIKNTHVSGDKSPVVNKDETSAADHELPFAPAPRSIVHKETSIQVPMASAPALPPVAIEAVPEKIDPVVIQEPETIIVRETVIVDAPGKDVPADSKPVESIPASVILPTAQKPAVARPKVVPAQLSAASTESVELYRIILENLSDELTKTQRIAEILRVYPDAKIGDLREALGDEPTLRIDGSVRRAKELLKSGK
jgi:hypothetical protein